MCSELGITLNRDPSHSRAAALQAVTPQVADQRLPPSSSRRTCAGTCGRNLLGLETQNEAVCQRQKRLVTGQVSTEHRWSRGDRSYWLLLSEGTLRTGDPSSWLLQAKDSEADIFNPFLQSSTKSIQGTKLLRVNMRRLLSPGPGKNSAIPPQAKTYDTPYNRPLPQKISKHIQPRPTSPIKENSTTPELKESNAQNPLLFPHNPLVFQVKFKKKFFSYSIS